MKNKLVSVAKILNFHGIKGEAKLGFSKHNTEFVQNLKQAYFYVNGEYVLYKISYVKINNKNAIIKFEGINSIDDVMEFKGESLYVPECDLKGTLEEDEFLTSDLLGMDVYDNDTKVAVVVGLTSNGGTDLLTVKCADEKVYYIPFVKDICTKVDMKEKRVYINNIEGLIS